MVAIYNMVSHLIAGFRFPFEFNAPQEITFRPSITFTVDFSAPIQIILGIALWKHRSWSRTVLLVFGWLGAGVLLLILLVIPVFGTGPLKFQVGSEAITNPPV